MKILHTEASCGWGGQEIRILSEARGLIGRGHDVCLACPKEARIFVEAHRFGVPVEALPIGKKRVGGILALRRYLQGNRFDVINTHSSTDAWLSALACRSLSRPPPIVRTRHVSVPVSGNFATRWLYGVGTQAIATTGEALREQLLAALPLNSERVVSVPTGVDIRRFSPGDSELRRKVRETLAVPEDALLIGIVATLRSWKGHGFLLEAMANRSLQSASLLIVGDGPQREALMAQAEALGITDRVRFVGNQNDVVPWLNSIDVFVLPSYANEGVPQALMQAMACGLPCVTTSIGAIGELAQPDRTALIVPTRDSAALAMALARLLSDQPLRERLACAARAHVVAAFDLERMLDRMEALFVKVKNENEQRISP